MNIVISGIHIPKLEATNEQLVDGAILTQSQKLMIQQHMTGAAQELCNIDYNPGDPHTFTQNHAALKGQLAAFQFLLDLSSTAETLAREIATQNQQSPQ